MASRPIIAILSSEGARSGADSPLVQFVRSQSKVLKKFEIHATGGTGESILSTGFYNKADVKIHHSGVEGGIVELAALVARGQCVTVIFLSDPSDQVWAETVALQRVCREEKVRLVTTFAAAEQWARFEAEELLREAEKANGAPSDVWRPQNWRDSKHENVGKNGRVEDIPIDHQTLALIAHDNKKEELVVFVNKHIEFLNRFDRILTTGTTGYVLKLLYSDNSQREEILKETRMKFDNERYDDLMSMYWFLRIVYSDGTKERAREELGDEKFKKLEERLPEADSKKYNATVKLSVPKANFVGRLMPLPSGPRGGDILIAAEILRNLCHAVIFFINPMTAHPHEADIRLFERTCQQRYVYAACISDPSSADRWAKTMEMATISGQPIEAPLDRQLCNEYGLTGVVIVNAESDEDSELLGRSLAQATAGYLNAWLSERLGTNDSAVIGIGHGWTTREILNHLRYMEKEGMLEKPKFERGSLLWCPTVANLEAVANSEEAAVLASDFAEFYGGEAKAFRTSNFIEREATIPHKEDQDLLATVKRSDFTIITAAPWNSEASFYKWSRLDPGTLPPLPEEGGPVAMVSTTFLDEKGGEYIWKYRAIGLGHNDIKASAKKGAVLLVCGGNKRQKVVLAAIRGGLVSVLVTTNLTAEWLLKAGVNR